MKKRFAVWIVRKLIAWANKVTGGGYYGLFLKRTMVCRYGENPWQVPASFCSNESGDPLSIDQFLTVGGGSISFVTITDIDRLLQTVSHIAATHLIKDDPKLRIAV